MVMNANLSFSDWHNLYKLDSGMYGVSSVDPNQPEKPDETRAVPRIVQLNPGQPLFRWVHSNSNARSLEQKAAGSWWSSKRGAQYILERARKSGTTDTSEHARWYSNVARSWGSDLAEVVHVMVVQPVKAFLGVGRDIHDEATNETWDSRGLQIYIPQMSEERNGVRTLSRIARHHFRIVWVKSSRDFEAYALEAAMRKGRALAKR
jgi:hypothetical protein